MAHPEQIDRYVLRGVLGEGNMGRVYLAYDPKFNREVALKTIRDSMVDEERVRKWFHREARAMAQLQHPGIVEVHDYSGLDTNVPYLVMERLHGHTLGAVAKKLGVFPDAVICEVAIQLAQAAAHAHGQGLIHRDLKPDNVFVEPQGRMVITDFGLARAQMNVDLGASLASMGTSVIGTPLFLAPESIHDPKNASPASDIYAIGVILYYLACLDMPFNGSDPFQVLSRILSGQHKPVGEVRRDLPRVLADAIEKVFASDRSVRVKNGEELEALFSSVRQKIAPGVDTLAALRDFLNQSEEIHEFTVATAVNAPHGEAALATPTDVITGQQTQITQQITQPMGQVPQGSADTQIAKIGETQIATVGGTQTRVVTAVPARSPRQGLSLAVWGGLLALAVVTAAALLILPRVLAPPGTAHAQPSGPGVSAPAEPRAPLPLPAPVEPPHAPTRGDAETAPATPAVVAPSTPAPGPAAIPAPPIARATHDATARPSREPVVRPHDPPPKVKVVEVQAPGTLRVNTGSVWADIFINGEKKGATPIKAVIELPPGKYSVRLVNPDYGAQEHRVTIVSGEVTPLRTTLDKK